jgi:hypothetical protein
MTNSANGCTSIEGSGTISSDTADRNSHYTNYVRPIIEEILHVLDCDLQHMVDNGRALHSLDAMLACEYYQQNLSCLNGYRNEAVNLMNLKLREYKVSEQYRFD